MHEIDLKCFVAILDESVRRWIVLVVESEAPGGLLALAGQTYGRVELDSDRKVPLQRLLVVLEPHLAVVIDFILRCELVE